MFILQIAKICAHGKREQCLVLEKVRFFLLINISFLNAFIFLILYLYNIYDISIICLFLSNLGVDPEYSLMNENPLLGNNISFSFKQTNSKFYKNFLKHKNQIINMVN